MTWITDGTVHAALQRWRDEDHEDTVTLLREQVIDLCEEYRSALPHMGGVKAAIQNSVLYQCTICADIYPEGSCHPSDADFANAEGFRQAINSWWNITARAALAPAHKGSEPGEDATVRRSPVTCPKCGRQSGDDWKHCPPSGCPMRAPGDVS